MYQKAIEILPKYQKENKQIKNNKVMIIALLVFVQWGGISDK